ncbi:hypothetical protein IAQ67_29330 (plasmid) [Paenibacillus peoriae]|uniref:Uncharacterized protein n=1 Tax=Paenibacillus peoriae TaxID=59893 RepID=A0A7H0YHK4_9BACL|nr:hypothetical protein [Paenibacillus peoriae]QNR70562.1 hypothetical protein IAQ67_29330 [Paenibacillus peoriae]
MLNEKIIVRVNDQVPGYEGQTVGVARQGDVFIFRSPIGNLEGSEYLACYKLGRSDFIEPYKRSRAHEWAEQEEMYRVYFQQLARRFSPIIQAYCDEGRNDFELCWSIMIAHGVESHYEDLMLFSQFLWRTARELEEKEPDNLKRIDQVYEMIKAVSKIFEFRADYNTIETNSIYFKADDKSFWKGSGF